jgi:alkanesulfonate monooxygenase SsuD/methylene tetrahydromethanopterin reductase-like flavin-dependent oxidoreductase (luciferase family)
MKFYTFDELTYPDVPPEVGPEVRFTNRFCDPRTVTQAYRDHLDEWAICEDLGFDGAFVNEHHFTAVNIQPACNIMAAAIIMRTKSMKVGVIGNVIPLRHPIRTAEEFAMLDCLSGGRFIAGIVRGVPQEYVSYNVDPFTSRERLAESYDVIHRCLNEEIFDYDGKYWQLTGVSIWPKPIQHPLPFWMPAGSLETIEFAAQRHINSAQVFYPPEAFRDAFDQYKKVARERFGWHPDFDNFIGARFIHVAETNDQAIAEARAALGYLFRVFSRPINNPAPVPGLHSDQSFQHRTNIKRDFPGPETPFEQMRDDGFIVCGDPDYVTRWLERDMKISGYGHFLGMFHIGNIAHANVMNAKRLFAKHVMPALRDLNVTTPTIEPSRAAHVAVGSLNGRTTNPSELPLYNDFNYVITRDAPEILRDFSKSENGRIVAGWEIGVPSRGPDGFPYQIIFAGPAREYRGSAIRLRLMTTDGREVSGDADVILETCHPSGGNSQLIFQNKYSQFAAIPDQHATNAANALHQRAVVAEPFIIRLRVTVPAGSPAPDPAADESFFEIECFKHWLNVTA